MTLKEYKDAVKILCVEIHEEDMDEWEREALDRKITLYANMGMQEIARNVYRLPVSVKQNGVSEWTPPDDLLALMCYEGGKAERRIGENGKEELHLLEEKPYRITYSRMAKAVQEDTDTFEFPPDVMNALIYFGAYHVLSADNDKRGFVYFKNLYDQTCVNIIANRPSRMTVVGGKR